MSFTIAPYFPGCGVPAVKLAAYQLDTQVLRIRAVFGYALAWIAMAALYWACPPLGLLASQGGALGFTAIALLPTIPAFLEALRGYKCLNDRAITSFLDESFEPSEETMQRLAFDPVALRELSVKMTSSPNTVTLTQRASLLNDKIFSKDGSWAARLFLINKTRDLLEKDANGRSLFLRAVEFGDISFLERVYTKLMDRRGNRSTIWDIDYLQRAEILQQVRHPDVLIWLRNKGWDICKANDTPSNLFSFLLQETRKNEALLLALLQERARFPYQTTEIKEGGKALLALSPDSFESDEEKDTLVFLQTLARQKQEAELVDLGVLRNLEALETPPKGLLGLSVLLPLTVPLYAAWTSSIPLLPKITLGRQLALCALLAGVGYYLVRS